MAGLEDSKLIWIASAPDTHFKPRHEGHLDEHSVFRQKKANMNEFAETTAVQQTCKDSGIDLAQEPPGHLFSLALVRPKYVYDELRELQSHEWLQHDVFQRLYGGGVAGRMFFFEVLAVHLLPQPSPIQAVGVRRTKSFFFVLEDGQAQRLAALVQVEDLPPLLQGHIRTPDFNETCARIPKPFAVLCSRGLWPSFGVADLFRPPSLFRGWSIAASPQVWEAAQYPQQRFAAEEEPRNIVDPAVSQEFLEDIRRIAAGLQQALPDQNAQPLLQTAHVIASSLQKHIFETNSAYRIGDAPRAGNEAYNIHYLINCFFLGDILKSDEKLQRTLELACRIALLSHVCEVVLKLFKDGDRPVPSKSTISRLRLKLVVSAMLLTRHWLQTLLQNRAAPGVVTHAMADSSPQDGHDYELVSLCVIPRQNLASLHVEITKLLASRSKPLREREDWLAEEREIMERVRCMMHH